MSQVNSTSSLSQIMADIDLGPTGSIQFLFAKLQLAQSEICKNQAESYMYGVEASLKDETMKDKFTEDERKQIEDLKDALSKDLDLKKIAAMVKTRIETFLDIAAQVDFFEALPEYDIAMYTHKKMKTTSETSLEVLEELLPIFEAQDDYSNDALYQTLVKFVEEKGSKNGYVMWPVRTAVSGKQMTPAGATEIMEVLGKEESLNRIRKGIELLQNA